MTCFVVFSLGCDWDVGPGSTGTAPLVGIPGNSHGAMNAPLESSAVHESADACCWNMHLEVG